MTTNNGMKSSSTRRLSDVRSFAPQASARRDIYKLTVPRDLEALLRRIAPRGCFAIVAPVLRRSQQCEFQRPVDQTRRAGWET